MLNLLQLLVQVLIFVLVVLLLFELRFERFRLLEFRVDQLQSSNFFLPFLLFIHRQTDRLVAFHIVVVLVLKHLLVFLLTLASGLLLFFDLFLQIFIIFLR